MLRNHYLFLITYTYHERQDQYDIFGDRVSIGYERDITTKVYRVLASSEALALALFESNYNDPEMKRTVVSVENTGPIDAFIEKHLW